MNNETERNLKVAKHNKALPNQERKSGEVKGIRTRKPIRRRSVRRGFEIPAEAVEVSSTEQQDTVEESSVESEDSPYGEGSAFALEDGSAPSSDYVIKAKVSTKIYHPEESSFFGRTKADIWFTDAETAEAAGFRLE